MKIRTALPALFCLLLSSRVASPEDPPDAGEPAESMPFLGSIPMEKSKVPALAEWNAAKDIGGRYATWNRCKLRRVREWLRLRCLGENGLGAELLAGTRGEASFSNVVEEKTCTETEPGYPQSERTCKTRVELVFPIRRGDRRYFQVVREGKKKWTHMLGFQPSLEVDTTLSASWLEDEPSPVVVMKQYVD